MRQLGELPMKEDEDEERAADECAQNSLTVVTHKLT